MKSNSRSASEVCLFTRGPCKAIRDHKRNDIRIETTRDHPDGDGMIICRLELGREREAQAIVALHDLIKAAGPFAAMGIVLLGLDSEGSLIEHAGGVKVTVGHMQRMAEATERALLKAADRITTRAKSPKPKNVP